MKPKRKPIKSVVRRRKEKRLVTKPARQKWKRDLARTLLQLHSSQAQGGKSNGQIGIT